MSRQPLRPAVAEATAVLHAAGVPSPRADAESLAAHLLGVERTRLGLVPMVEPALLEAYRKMVEQRAKRIPLQYITGLSPMGEIDVEVGPGVFVPRPETELLLAWALAFLECRHAPVVLDLCTGSGALALAIAHARPDAEVHAVELDPLALDWARRNAERQGYAGDTPIALHAGDAIDPLLLPDLDGRVDLLVANPPYVPDGTGLDREVAEHDPPAALFGGPDGLDVIRELVPNVYRWLALSGAAGVEHDDSHGAQVVELLVRHGGFVDVVEHVDLAGRPRFVVAHRALG